MANVPYVSTVLTKFVAEAARLYIQAEASLTTPLANVSMSFGETLLTISGTLPKASSVDVATGNIVVSFIDNVPDADPVLTGTVLSDVTASSLAEVLFAALVRLDAAESARISSNGTLPAGVGSTYSFSDTAATFTAVLPISYSLDASGNQVATVSNYLA